MSRGESREHTHTIQSILFTLLFGTQTSSVSELVGAVFLKTFYMQYFCHISRVAIPPDAGLFSCLILWMQSHYVTALFILLLLYWLCLGFINYYYLCRVCSIFFPLVTAKRITIHVV